VLDPPGGIGLATNALSLRARRSRRSGQPSITRKRNPWDRRTVSFTENTVTSGYLIPTVGDCVISRPVASGNLLPSAGASLTLPEGTEIIPARRLGLKPQTSLDNGLDVGRDLITVPRTAA